MNKRRNYTLLPITVNHDSNITLRYCITRWLHWISIADTGKFTPRFTCGLEVALIHLRQSSADTVCYLLTSIIQFRSFSVPESKQLSNTWSFFVAWLIPWNSSPHNVKSAGSLNLYNFSVPLNNWHKFDFVCLPAHIVTAAQRIHPLVTTFFKCSQYCLIPLFWSSIELRFLTILAREVYCIVVN